MDRIGAVSVKNKYFQRYVNHTDVLISKLSVLVIVTISNNKTYSSRTQHQPNRTKKVNKRSTKKVNKSQQRKLTKVNKKVQFGIC